MKLNELVNVVSPGNKTNLSGGDLPNAYRDDASKANKLPRTKKKDVYGTGGIATSVDTGDGGEAGGDTGGDTGGTGDGGGAGDGGGTGGATGGSGSSGGGAAGGSGGSA